MTTLPVLFDEKIRIPASHGEELQLRHRRLTQQTHFDASHTVLMMHGATYSSGSLFDIPMEGQSFMDYLALAGFDVWAVDVRGYGGSSRPAAMNTPASEHPPAVGAKQASADLATAIDYLLHRLKLQHINLLGMSWGGSVTGYYTSQNNNKIRRLVLIAPQWLTTLSPLDPGGELGAWRLIDIPAVKSRWLRGVPQDKQQTLIPRGGFELWAERTLAEEPAHELRIQQKIKASNGPVQDTRDYWTNNSPLYDPADIRVPLLLLHGEWDADIPVSLAQSWFLRARHSPEKIWVEIGEATHMMVLEKNRHQVYAAAARFLKKNHPETAL